MNHQNKKIALTAILFAALAVAAYWYWSPFLALREMQSAAKAQDADAFNAHVDYPRLRESLKEQLAADMKQKMAASTDANNPLGAIGALLGAVVFDKVVDAMVRPETVMRSMQSGQFSPQTAPPAGPQGAPQPAAQEEAPKWTYIRKGTDMLVAYPAAGAEPYDKKMHIVFERSGFANWKLTDLRMPAMTP
jgi:hypothetical protein